MDYKSTLVGLGGFWNASAGFSEHQFRALTTIYTLVKVRVSWKLLIVVCSFSDKFEACHID